MLKLCKSVSDKNRNRVGWSDFTDEKGGRNSTNISKNEYMYALWSKAIESIHSDFL